MGRERDQVLRDVVAGRFGALRRSAYLMCGDWSMADDLSGSVLAVLVVNLRDHRADDPADSTRAALMDAFLAGRWRRARRRERVFSGVVGEPGGPDPVVRVAVLAALSRLPPRRRAVIVLRHWEELSVLEVADVMGCAARTVVAHETRGLTTLRETLGDLLPPGPVPSAAVRRRRGGRHAVSRHAATRHRVFRGATRHRADARRWLVDAAEIDPGLRELFARVLADEPPAGNGIAQVFARAERLRRRRARAAVAASVCTVLAVALAGYGLTEMVVPRTASALLHRPSSGTAAGDLVGVGRLRARIAAAVAAEGLRLEADRHGVGWRRYTLMAAGGEPTDRTPARGTVQVVTYTTPGGMCFPVASAAEGACARTERTGHGVEFVRYSGDDQDVPFHQVIARRTSDGRTVAVIVAGSGDAGSAAGDVVPSASSGAAGSGAPEPAAPPLTAGQVTALAIDSALPDTFGSDEWCDRVDPGCPDLRVPLVDGDVVGAPR